MAAGNIRVDNTTVRVDSETTRVDHDFTTAVTSTAGIRGGTRVSGSQFGGTRIGGTVGGGTRIKAN